MLLLILLECLVCFIVWRKGIAVALGDQSGRRDWDRLQQRRRADWVRGELQERPLWWLMLGGLMVLVLADWFAEKWAQRPWRAAIVWTIAMSVMLVAAMALTERLGGSGGPLSL
jgi:hypothetical protein